MTLKRHSFFFTHFRCLLIVSVMSIASGCATSNQTIKDPYGSSISGAQVDRVVRISPSTRSVNVERFERVRFEFTESGKSFQWHFYTLGTPVIKLSQIAPDLGQQQDVMIYVSLSPSDAG